MNGESGKKSVAFWVGILTIIGLMTSAVQVWVVGPSVTSQVESRFDRMSYQLMNILDERQKRRDIEIENLEKAVERMESALERMGR